MIRTLRIINLHFINIFQHRTRAFIWFLISLFNPLILLLYWNGTNQITPSLITYYLLLIIAGSTLESHVEDSVSDIDIKQGGLVKFILKPFSYYWLKFFGDATTRLTLGLYGLLSFIMIALIAHTHLILVSSPMKL